MPVQAAGIDLAWVAGARPYAHSWGWWVGVTFDPLRVALRVGGRHRAGGFKGPRLSYEGEYH